MIISRVLRFLGFHVWAYRNPYSRRCKACGEHQDLWENAGGDRWEIMHPLVQNSCGSHADPGCELDKQTNKPTKGTKND